jgi:hypothetical protein
MTVTFLFVFVFVLLFVLLVIALGFTVAMLLISLRMFTLELPIKVGR